MYKKLDRRQTIYKTPTELLEMKTVAFEMKNTLDGISKRLEIGDDQ